ncbi:MAG: hypothetical protein ACRDYB_02490 [Acidimicrobiales bacterium]
MAVLDRTPREQVGALVGAVIQALSTTGVVGLTPAAYEALDVLRAFNYERIYTGEIRVRQRVAAIQMLQALVGRYATTPVLMGRPELVDGSDEAIEAAVTYAVGMTERYACDAAVSLLGWDELKLSRAI